MFSLDVCIRSICPCLVEDRQLLNSSHCSRSLSESVKFSVEITTTALLSR